MCEKEEDIPDAIRKVTNTMALSGMPPIDEDIEELKSFQKMSPEDREKERKITVRT